MPEIALNTCKFDADFSAPEIGFDVNHAAFPFFFRYNIHEQKRLSPFYFHIQWQESAVDADSICFRGCPEWPVGHGASVNSNRYRQA